MQTSSYHLPVAEHRLEATDTKCNKQYIESQGLHADKKED